MKRMQNTQAQTHILNVCTNPSGVGLLEFFRPTQRNKWKKKKKTSLSESQTSAQIQKMTKFTFVKFIRTKQKHQYSAARSGVRYDNKSNRCY